MGKGLTKLVAVGDLLLDPEQNCGVPLVEPVDGVVVLDLFGEGLHVLVLQMLTKSLIDVKRCKRKGKSSVSGDGKVC